MYVSLRVCVFYLCLYVWSAPEGAVLTEFFRFTESPCKEMPSPLIFTFSSSHTLFASVLQLEVTLEVNPCDLQQEEVAVTWRGAELLTIWNILLIQN